VDTSSLCFSVGYTTAAVATKSVEKGAEVIERWSLVTSLLGLRFGRCTDVKLGFSTIPCPSITSVSFSIKNVDGACGPLGTRSVTISVGSLVVS
jgi:hypothetical protein